MPERTSYAPGTPSWVDLGSPDTAASAAFYGELFGWDAAMDPRPEAGGYGMFMIGDKTVAGLGPQMNPDLPPFWAVYITVADADETAAKVAANGGTVIVPPMDIFDAGRMGVAQDSVGSFISFWQPREHIGCQLVNEPGTFSLERARNHGHRRRCGVLLERVRPRRQRGDGGRRCFHLHGRRQRCVRRAHRRAG